MKCQYADGRCFALGAERECLALSETTFANRCPFFKPSPTDYTIRYTFDNRPGTWVKVRGYNGKYYVSDRGEVMNAQRAYLQIHYRKGRAFVRLYDGTNTARYYVAVLVADAFIPGAGEGKVAHKDGNTLNCSAENLYRK